MDRADPFTGYSVLLRILIYGVIPAFGAWQFVRLRRAAHVYQLESYKPVWFLRWCRADRGRALFLGSLKGEKKPLVMTGRVWRMTVSGAVLTVLAILTPAGVAHLAGGAPYDLIVAGAMFGVAFYAVRWFLLAGDLFMRPVQYAINARHLRAARSRLDDVGPLVIGVTGSYGKTSTKFAIQRLLGDPGEVLATPGSFNTPLGVARTINESLGTQHRYFVVEMGARHLGDVAEICSLVRPSIAVLTALGPAHLESFGSIEAIARAKYEIVQALPDEGVAVMNVDDEGVRTLADATEQVRVIRYGIEPGARPDVTARDVEVTGSGTALTLVDVSTGASAALATKLLGRHAIEHLLAAVAVSLATGSDLRTAAVRASGLEPVEHRLQIIEGSGGVTVIDDAYNSNPAGAAAALDVLARMPGRRKVVVTPGMVELGELQVAANRELGRLAGKVADSLIVVAELNRSAIVAGAEEVGAGDKVIVVDSLADATERLRSLLGSGDVVLFENDLPDQYES